MPDIEKNGCVFLSGADNAGGFRGWRPSDIPRDDFIFIAKGVDVAQGYDPAHDPSDRSYAATRSLSTRSTARPDITRSRGCNGTARPSAGAQSR